MKNTNSLKINLSANKMLFQPLHKRICYFWMILFFTLSIKIKKMTGKL